MEKESAHEKALNFESCNAILDTAKTIYNEEVDRFKQTETKTGVTIGFVGVLFGFFLTYIGSTKISSEDIGYLIYTFGLRLVIVALLTVSILKFISAIKVGEFDQIDINNIVDNDLAKESPEDVTMKIAATYQDVIEKNEKKVDQKTDKYNEGIKFMIRGFLLFLIYFFVEELLKYV